VEEVAPLLPGLENGAGAYTISTMKVWNSEVEWIEARVASFEVTYYIFHYYHMENFNNPTQLNYHRDTSLI
jgi:hypothetical protein